ncbi:MAG: C25 family cysteine peptidase [Pyrinomonadaceae bacterium]
MFKMSSLSSAAGKKSFRLFTLVIGFSVLITPLISFTQTTVMAQSSDAGDFEKNKTADPSLGTQTFEKEYLKPVTDTSGLTDSKSSFSGTTTESLRGRGNGGGTTTPPTPTPNLQWAIAATAGVKISVNHEGWYRVPADQLQAAGFDVNSNRTYWQLFSDAVEQSIKVNSDGSIEFLGKELDTIQTNTRVYFLISGQTAGKRIGTGTTKVSDTNNAPNFDITVERKPRLNYIPGVLNGESENWFGDVIYSSVPEVENISVYNPDVSGTARLNVRLQGLTETPHTVNVKFNNLVIGSVSFSNYQNITVGFDVPMSAVVAGSNQVALQTNLSSDYALVDTISLTYKRLYEARNNRLHFSVPARSSLRVNDFTENSINVFELTNGQIQSELSVAVQSSGGSYSFSIASSRSNRELLAVTNSEKELPLSVEPNYSSNWNSISNNANFVIIAPPVFAQYAQTLANMRIQQGLNTKVVLTDDIYDEFSYGAESPQGIRDFLNNAVTYWQVKPQYVLLFGDSSYDSRGYLDIANRNLVPAKLVDTYFFETMSDAWYTDFNNDMIEDIAIGRLPAGNAAEAAQMVEKLASYDAQGNHQVKKGVFIADTIFATYSQQLAGILPATAQAAVINRSQMTDTQMQQEIFAQGSDNPLLVVYTGHGTPVGWTNAGLLSVYNVGNLTNSQLGFYMVVGCLNGYSQDPYNDSLAEALLKSPNGAMGVFASSGSITVSGPTAMSPVLTDKVFNSQPNNLMRIGDILRLAKQSSTNADANRTYQLFGDPTVYVK